MTLVEKRQQRGAHVEAMRKILDVAGKREAEKRALTAEETQEYDRLDTAQEALGAEIAREERLAGVESLLRQTTDSGLRPQPAPAGAPEARTLGDKRFHRLFSGGSTAEPDVDLRDVLDADALRDLERRAQPGYTRLFRALLSGNTARAIELRTLQMDVFTKGGALVAPLEFIADLIQGLDDAVFIRGLARKFTVTQAEGLGVPTLDTDIADADWTTELATGSQGTMAFGRREFRPHPLAKRIKVSNKLMRASAIPVESLVRDRLNYKFALTEEKAFLTGDGTQKPLGVFTASADGIPTTRDVSTGNTTTAIGADGLIEAKYSLKAPYWPRASWIFGRTALASIRKLKDGNGQYLWAPGLSGGQPDRILDAPFFVSEHAPAVFTTGLYVGIIGDFSHYWIVDALDVTVQRLVELYAETNETGFIGRKETDGAPVLAEAFARVKLS